MNEDKMRKHYNGVDKDVLIEILIKSRKEISDLNERFNRTIKYCENSSMTLKSHYFMDVIKILKGSDKE